MKFMKAVLLATLFICLTLTASAFGLSRHNEKQEDERGHKHGHEQIVFGPQKFERDKGRPETETVNFSVDKSGPEYFMLIEPGKEKRPFDFVNAEITLNGKRVVGHMDFLHPFGPIEKRVSLRTDNILKVKVNGRPGSFIIITIKGKGNAPTMATVPDVSGMTREAAEAAITSAYLIVGTETTQFSATVPAGKVVKQDPAAGTSLRRGSPVNLVISAGPETVTVPDLSNMDQTSAERTITASGLTVGVVTSTYSDTIAEGLVTSQVPAAGSSVPRGSAVSLVVSLGPAGPVLPPDPATTAQPVNGTVPTTVATSTEFLYTGDNPIQTGVAAGAIVAERAAVLRGKVIDKDGNPLSGATVSILGHPEFGQTLSRADGMFDMAVNGGGILTVNYAKDGYMPAQRQANTPWNDYAWLSDVAMLPYDRNVTTINLSSAATTQVARGGVSTDSDGTRRATLLFSGGTTAQMVMPDGTTRSMTSLNVRATEYTVGPNGPRAMPAELPPTSAYTYAVELSADEAVSAGATEVRFSKPVYLYVENFLGFPDGGAVPAGYYDFKKAAWVPSENGRVIKILGVTAGLADIDTDGSGTAADAAKLASLGITGAERQQLASLYPAGQSLWRTPVSHFTPWDCNWPYGPPEDAESPNQPKPETNESVKDPCEQSGSIIECQNQTLGESLPITGTPFSLNYRSDRTPGRNAQELIKIKLSGASVPASLQAIILQIDVAGKRITKSFPPAPNSSYTFAWDGLDAYGRRVYGTQTARVSIGYQYGLVRYLTSTAFYNAFARIGNSRTTVTLRATGEPIIVWQGPWLLQVKAPAEIPKGLGGWFISAHHDYDIRSRTLFRGDASFREVEPKTNKSGIIERIAGLGDTGSSVELGDGGPAVEAYIESPVAVAFGPDGSMYIQQPNRTRKVALDGTISTVAGNGQTGNSGDTVIGDGGPATSALINNATDIAAGPDGSLYIAESNTNTVRKVAPDGNIYTVAGGSDSAAGPSYGDGGPATEAKLNYLSGIDLGRDGSLYIAENYGYRVRRVGPDGIISTVAGTGYYNSAIPDEGVGPATETSILPKDITIDREGGYLIADVGHKRLHRVSSEGSLTTINYSSSSATSLEEFAPAATAYFYPNNTAPGPDGSIYISDTQSHRIRMISPAGIISTVAGNGHISGQSATGDGGSATSATLSSSFTVTAGPDGSLYIADRGNNCVRRVSFDRKSLSDEFLIASEDGKEAYIFDGYGRHLRTVNSLTGSTIYRFSYDTEGRLSSITDGDGDITVIERDASGAPVAISAPFGQRTLLTVDANGYINSIANPAGEAYSMTYTSDGLMTSFTDPKGNQSRMNYDEKGYLTRDENAAGGFSALAGTRSPASSTVTLTTALDRTTTYHTEGMYNGQIRTITLPTGAVSVQNLRSDGVIKYNSPDNTITTTTKTPDPRFGMQAPVESVTIQNPSGLSANLSSKREVSLSDEENPLSLTSQTDTVTLNGRKYVTIFDSTTKQMTATTPAGRQSLSLLNSQGRLLSYAPDTDVTPLAITYDTHGRISQTTQGNLQTTYSYDSSGRLASQTDALGNNVQYGYDNANRVSQLMLPSGRIFKFEYDANGNNTKITMPGGAVHSLGYTVINLGSDYTPPDNPSYSFSYSLDQEWTGTLLPGGRRVDAGYDDGGRQTVRIYPEASTSFDYSDATGRVSKIVHTPTGGAAQEISLSYDGSLVTSRSFSGTTNGSFSYTYNNDFLPVSIDLKSSSDSITTAITRDEDGQVTGYGQFGFTREGPGGSINTIYDKVTVPTYGNTVVPDVVGMNSKDAYSIILEANLLPGEETYDYSGSIPLGTIIRQEPAAGSSVSQWTAVSLVISSQPGVMLSPDIFGTFSTYASNKIFTNPPVNSNNKIPLHGTKLLAMAGDTAPTLLTSATVTVPDVVGMTQANAEAAILLANLNVGTPEFGYSDDIPAGNVITQSPGAGSSVSEGSYVYLHISNGPGRSVPYVIGMPQDEAIASILAENLVIGTVKTVFNPDVPPGEVIEVYPHPYSFMQPGDKVSMLVSGGFSFVENFAHDNLGRIGERTYIVNGNNVYSIRLSYDARGAISRKIETVSGVETSWDYTYDVDGQLTGVKKNGADVEIFAYDLDGNRTGYQQPGAFNVLADYDSQDRIVRLGGLTYQFNADGQLTQRGTDTFRYSATGELLQADVSGETVTYSYDGTGRRVARTDSSGTWQYLYGNLEKPFQLTAMRDPSGVLSYYYYDDNGLLFAFDKGGTRYYVATDQVGTPKVVTDTAGTVVKLMEYDSFGMQTLDGNPSFDMPVGFAGGINDTRTSLVRFGYRDYEPSTGRWTAKDPIFFAGGQGNLYGYVQNNPVNFVDPFGLREYTVLDFPDLIISPFQIHDFKKTMKQLFNQEYKRTGRNYWKNLNDNYSTCDASKDFFRYDPKEALDHYRQLDDTPPIPLYMDRNDLSWPGLRQQPPLFYNPQK